MRVLAGVLFSSTIMLAPAIAAAQATTAAPAGQVAQATTAPAAPTVAPAPSANESASVNLDEVVCKNEPPATGSRLGGGRECHTVREWNERQRESQDLTRHQEVTGFKVPGG